MFASTTKERLVEWLAKKLLPRVRKGDVLLLTARMDFEHAASMVHETSKRALAWLDEHYRVVAGQIRW